MKLEITRKELGKIFDIACKDWKEKINEFGARTPFLETVTFLEKEIQGMLNACTDVQLPIVREIFEIKDITSEIKTFENALTYLTEDDEEVIIYRKLVKADITSHVLYNQMAVCFVKALNEKHVFNWNDSNEKKWRIWWYASSFRFYGSFWFDSHMDVAASLCFKNENLAICAGNNKEFVNICEKFMK